MHLIFRDLQLAVQGHTKMHSRSGNAQADIICSVCGGGVISFILYLQQYGRIDGITITDRIVRGLIGSNICGKMPRLSEEFKKRYCPHQLQQKNLGTLFQYFLKATSVSHVECCPYTAGADPLVNKLAQVSSMHQLLLRLSNIEQLPQCNQEKISYYICRSAAVNIFLIGGILRILTMILYYKCNFS